MHNYDDHTLAQASLDAEALAEFLNCAEFTSGEKWQVTRDHKRLNEIGSLAYRHRALWEGHAAAIRAAYDEMVSSSLVQSDEMLGRWANTLHIHGGEIDHDDLDYDPGPPPVALRDSGHVTEDHDHRVDFAWHLYEATHPEDNRAVVTWTDGVAQQVAQVCQSTVEARFFLDLLIVTVRHDRWLDGSEPGLTVADETLHRVEETSQESAQDRDGIEPDDEGYVETGGILTVGMLRKLIDGLEDLTQVTVATDGWYDNVVNVGVPNPDAEDGTDNWATLTLFPSEPATAESGNFDSRQL